MTTARLNYLGTIVFTLLFQWDDASTDASPTHCRKMLSLGGGKQPEYVSVVSHFQADDVRWTEQMPVPVLLYTAVADMTSEDIFYRAPLPQNYSFAGSSSPEEHFALACSAVKLQFILDHYACFPTWTLFLSSRGRDARTGHTARANAPVVTHPVAPALSSALLDVRRIDRGFVSVGHLDESAVGTLLGPLAAQYGADAPKAAARMAFRAKEDAGARTCRSCGMMELLLNQEWRCDRPYGHPIGGEFWVRDIRFKRHTLAWWTGALELLLGYRRVALIGSSSSSSSGGGGGGGDNDDDAARSGNGEATRALLSHKQPGSHRHRRPGVARDSSSGNIARFEVLLPEQRAICFESLWHAILGENYPRYHYHPPWAVLEAYPRVR